MENESVVKDTSAFRPGLVVADAVYNPEETRLLGRRRKPEQSASAARECCCGRGVAAFKLYTGKRYAGRGSQRAFLARKVKQWHEEFISDRLYGRREKSTIAWALAKNARRSGLRWISSSRNNRGWQSRIFLPHMGGELFPRPGDRVVAVFSESTGYVVSCGGGSVLRDENAALMKENGCIVFLRATPETIYERVKDSTNRPILNGNMNVEYIRELMEKRRPRYEAVADICVDTDGKDVDAISEEILKAVEDRS